MAALLRPARDKTPAPPSDGRSACLTPAPGASLHSNASLPSFRPKQEQIAQEMPRSLILIPGYMCDGALFEPLMEDLHRGSVLPAFADIRTGMDMSAMASSILRTAPPRFAVAGLSLGGIVALEMVRQAPSRITHLALLNTTANADASRDLRHAHLKRIARGDTPGAIVRELAPGYVSAGNRTPAMMQLVSDMADRLGPDTMVRQTLALMSRDAYWDDLAAMALPTLVLAGADDRLCPPDISRRMALGLPRARLEILRDCGHLSPLEQPREVAAALLDLLAETGTRPTAPASSRGSTAVD
jgi:pimeloyl-ACP methyl ester carboxylesterase